MLEIETALVRDVRVRIERDVRECQRIADEELSAVEVTLHCGESPLAGRRSFGETIRELVRAAGVREPETRNRDRRLVVVLLEEHPLQDLRALVRGLRHETRALAEVPEDRARLRERPPVVEYERRHA